MPSCKFCGQAENSHEGFQHLFVANGEAGELRTKSAEKPPTLVALPDVVLRALLMDKGLVTAEELMAKEVEIRGRIVPPDPRVDG